MTILLHPDRYNPTSILVKRGVVVHDSESGDASASRLIALLQGPGDRPSGNGFYGAGYHAVTDGAGGYVALADASAGPFAAPPVNADWWHVCMPGFAAQTRAEWLDPLSVSHRRGVAKFIYDKWLEDGKTWALGFIFAADLARGIQGYTSHYQVSMAWKKSNHYDPGPQFPFDLLEADIQLILAAANQQTDPEEDEMNTARLVRFNGYINAFLVGGGGPPVAVGEADYDYLANTLKLPKIFVTHEQEMLSVVAQAGLDINNPAEMVPGGPSDKF